MGRDTTVITVRSPPALGTEAGARRWCWWFGVSHQTSQGLISPTCKAGARVLDLLRTHVWRRGHQTPPGAGAASVAGHGEHHCSFPISCRKKKSSLHTFLGNFGLRTMPGLAFRRSDHNCNPTVSSSLHPLELCCGGWAVPSPPWSRFVFTECLSLAGQYLNAQL